MTNSYRDSKLVAYRDSFRNGMEAMGFWWTLLEIVAEEVVDNRCSRTQKIDRWCRQLEVSRVFFANRCKKLCELMLISYVSHDETVTITIPNLLKIRDEYSRKSGHTPDILRTNSSVRARAKELETETETDNARARAREGRADKNPPKEKPQGGNGAVRNVPVPRWSDVEPWRLVKVCEVLGVDGRQEAGTVWQNLGGRYRQLTTEQKACVQAIVTCPADGFYEALGPIVRRAFPREE